MRRRLVQGLSLALLLTGSTGTAALANGRPFDKPGLTSPAYASLRKLEKAGYFTGFPQGTFDVARTRYEFAVAVERLYRSLQPRVLSAVEPGTLPEELGELRNLLDEFADDVADLGHDAKEIQRQVDAMRDRVDRLPKVAVAEEAPASTRPAPVLPVPRSGSTFGLRPALQASMLAAAMAPTGRSLRPARDSFVLKPGLAAALGPAILGVQIQPPDRLGVLDSLPLRDRDLGQAYQAQISLPVGSYLLSAYYNRQGAAWDRYGLSPFTALNLGPSETVGAQVSGTLFSPRLGFSLHSGSTRTLQADPSRFFSLGGGVTYDLGRGYNLGLGYQVTRQLGLVGGPADAGLFMGFGRSFGRNARFDAIYRGGENGSTITQVTVKF